MKQKFLLISSLLLLSAIAATAQNGTRITGQVKDAAGQPLPRATISLFKADSVFVKAEVTDNEGRYEINGIKPASYFITASSAGFQKGRTALFAVKDGESVAAPAIGLQPGGELKGVTVTGTYKKPMIEVKADKTVFNVESSINATGSNAMELLQKSPGVVVDKDDNISMKGKNGVRIYVDGRMTFMDNKDLAAYLRSINSADIESIEMIANPSAKYDASGNAGIINIRLKKNKKYGMNGNFSTGLNMGKTPKANNSLSLNYRNKKVNLFSNYSNRWGDNENFMSLYRVQADTIFDQDAVNNDGGWNHNIKAGIDVYINKENTIGFVATGNFTNGYFDANGVTPISPAATGVPTKVLFATNRINSNNSNLNFNFNYRYADSTGREFNMDADYGRFRGKANSFQPNYYKEPGTWLLLYDQIYRNNTPTDIDIFTAKFDYEKPWLKGKLGYGAKFSNVKTDNTFDFFDVLGGLSVKNNNRSNRFNYTENVNAAYVNYNRQINQRWSVQGGLRVENTNSKGVLESATVQDDKEVERHYTDYFPSGALTFAASQKHMFNLTYSRRIDRPGYQDLNPFENKLDELTYQKGNAFLRPQYTNSIELTHTFLYRFNTTLGYSRIKDFSTQLIDTTEKTRAFITQRNLASQDIYSINFALPFQITKWWSLFANINAFHSRNKATFDDGRVINLNVSSATLFMQQSFTFKDGFSAEISGFYASPTIWGGTFKTKSMGGLDLGVQKQLFNNKGTVKLSYTDLLLTMRWAGVSNFGNFMDTNGGWESQQMRLNFTYRFGNNQVKAARQRKSGNEDESKRIKSGGGGFGGN
jgi:iron complex outermembrane recepter protein